MYIKNTKLSSVKFESKDIINVRSWNVNKTHGHANIFIRMLKIYDSSIVEPLSIILQLCEWNNISWYLEKIKYVPIHKKGGKQITDQYQRYSKD